MKQTRKLSESYIKDMGNISLQTKVKLDQYVRLLERWKPVTNLVSRRKFDNLWARHVEDCLQLVPLEPTARRWVDIGSGAGFPGLIIAIQLSDIPETQVHLVETDGRKCVFLREVARELALPVQVHRIRAELLAPSDLWPIDVVTARAFATLRKTVCILSPFIEKGATALLPRGRTVSAELDALPFSCYSVQSVKSQTGHGGYILSIKRRDRMASQ